MKILIFFAFQSVYLRNAKKIILFDNKFLRIMSGIKKKIFDKSDNRFLNVRKLKFLIVVLLLTIMDSIIWIILFYHVILL